MRITATTTVAQLLEAGYTLTSPEQFELRDRPDDECIAKRAITPVGMTARGHLPLNEFGIYLACNEISDYAEMCAHEAL
jgi:hypothetical protein